MIFAFRVPLLGRKIVLRQVKAIRGGMSSLRFVGIDVAAERHVVAAVDETGAILLRATPVTEDTPGYRQLLELIGPGDDCLVAMEATGHYWRNL
jgi:hypothetical protein